jgi:hypothetical protein
MKSKSKKQQVPTPQPPRRFAPAAREEETSDQWLDAVDPERKRYDPPRVVATVRAVTPDDAREWLTHLPDYQRNKKERSLKNFEADMREGYWFDGVAVIAFDRRGDLINGQHVLQALIAAGREVLCIVVINRLPDAYLGYDLGIKRSLTDNLKGETSSPSAVSKVLHVLRLWDQGTYDARNGKGYINAREGSINLAGRRGRELLAATPGIVSHLFRNPFRTNSGTRSVAAMHAASYRLHQIDPELAAKFFERFREGTGLEKGDPVYALRKRFTEMEKEQRWRSGPTLAHILAAWNLFVNHEKCAVLPFRIGQAFPKVAVPLPVPESSRSSHKVQ